jgi:hypothetical protein
VATLARPDVTWTKWATLWPRAPRLTLSRRLLLVTEVAANVVSTDAASIEPAQRTHEFDNVSCGA